MKNAITIRLDDELNNMRK